MSLILAQPHAKVAYTQRYGQLALLVCYNHRLKRRRLAGATYVARYRSRGQADATIVHRA